MTKGKAKQPSHGSILHYLYKTSIGTNRNSNLRDPSLQKAFVRSLPYYRLHGIESCKHRITCLEWHPTHPTAVAFGNEQGSIFLWDYTYTGLKTLFLATQKFIVGGVKFCPSDLAKMYVTSYDGTLTLRGIDNTFTQVLSRAQEHDHHKHKWPWYCCLDLSVSRQMLAMGTNTEQLVLLGLDGHMVFSNKLHTAKVMHVEFNCHRDWLLATASLDCTVKLWDLRNIKDKSSCLHEMNHRRPVNSACFRPTDGSKLLTTDDEDEIRVYTAPDWSKPEIILHPNRRSLRLTPIKDLTNFLVNQKLCVDAQGAGLHKPSGTPVIRSPPPVTT